MNASSCLAYLSNHLPDVVLMDINLPDKSGIELCKEVTEKYPAVLVMGLSTFNQHSFIQKMIDNGAAGYVLKNATQNELTETIQTVMKGRQYLSLDAAQMLRGNQQAERPVLTRREIEMLDLIAEDMTNNAIAQTLFISSTTVDTHRKNLLLKFNAKNTAELVKLAIQSGAI